MDWGSSAVSAVQGTTHHEIMAQLIIAVALISLLFL
jgi:hypothetical protein